MGRSNGGTLGPKRVLTTSTASGIYGLDEIHRERIAGNFLMLNPPSTVEYLVVAGGGASGSRNPYLNTTGSGGGGGFRSSVIGALSGRNSSAETVLSVSASVAYTVTVGGGGVDSNGSNSVFSTITSLGGGRGGNNGQAGSAGGSGGGGGSDSGQSGGSGTAGQGFDGGSGNNAQGAGGSGGAGGAGENSGSGTAGLGLASSITGSSVTYSAGQNRGGAVRTYVANSGNGGRNGAGTSDSGDSGVVIIRYANTYDAAASTTGSPTITNTGGYRIYRWTGSGSITF